MFNIETGNLIFENNRALHKRVKALTLAILALAAPLIITTTACDVDDGGRRPQPTATIQSQPTVTPLPTLPAEFFATPDPSSDGVIIPRGMN